MQFTKLQIQCCFTILYNPRTLIEQSYNLLDLNVHINIFRTVILNVILTLQLFLFQHSVSLRMNRMDDLMQQEV